MRAIQMAGYGGAEILHLADVPTPEPAADQVRIRVRAAAVNPADHKWRQGMFSSFAPLSFPHVLGYDIAGHVDVAGAEVTGFSPGDRVLAMLNPFVKGGYAEYALAPAGDVVRLPNGLDFATAAAIPTAGLTGVQMAEDHARLSAGQTVLITGATGSVGRFAMSAAQAAGAQVVAAVRTSQVDEARALGARAVIVLGQEDWSSAPFDHVIDTVGGPDVAMVCRHVKVGGGIFTAATTPIDKQGLESEPVFVIVRNDPVRLAELVQAAATGDLVVPVARRLPLEAAAEAHRLMEQGGNPGKIILEP